MKAYQIVFTEEFNNKPVIIESNNQSSARVYAVKKYGKNNVLSVKKYRDYYSELKVAVDKCEDSYSYRNSNLCSITDKIDWCWKFRKITEAQMEELATRVTELFDRC